MAYFVLPGKGKRVYRLAIARRIVDGVVVTRAGAAVPPSRPGAPGARGGGGEGDRARRRTRVLRRAMRPSRRLGIGLGPWLRALPARLPDPALTGALARLDPPVRVAYVLRHVEGMSRYAVRDQLTDLRVRDPWPVIEAAEAAAVPEPRHADAFEPMLVRPVRRRSRLPVAAAAVLTVMLAGALVATESGEGSLLGGIVPGGSLISGSRAKTGRDLRLVTAAPRAWTRGAPTLDAWPARGDLAADEDFVRRALDAWADAPGAGRAAVGDTQLLYAGHAGATPVAVLRHGDRIAHYSDTTRAVEVVTAGADPTGPVALLGGRYLLSPWDTAPSTLTGGRIATRDGVTDPVTARTPCGRGPLFQVEGRDGPRTLGDLGGPRAAVLSYRPPSYRYVEGAAVPPARLPEEGLRLWERLGCLLPQPARPVTEAGAWDFWSGTLPHDGGTAHWVCTRMTFTGGGTAGQATLLRAADQLVTGWCDDRRPVSGTWWQAPSQRWYYLAAAGRGLVPHADGPWRPAKADDRLLVGTPSASGPHPDAPVTLTARTG
ncbi:hypothetical protein [Actinomadura xylanilytica]|uniref:hypothetical protein n=1 Tax=Actinomadura xylanilytica TaxID=887459 RepID=UPI00255A9D8B|nr:hypothetical protein [Actinomadura xylanilytica]MDL4774636.1 hypothetical protein [Actinomadura xylanilytica]